MLNLEQIVRQYEDEQMSVYEIAELHGTYPQKVRRLLLSSGIKMRTKGEAQSIALKKGRMEHPTKDKGHSETARLKISEGSHNVWKNLSTEEYEARKKASKDRWDNMSDTDKIALRDMGWAAVRVAAKSGSKLERFVQESLVNEGFMIQRHKIFELPGHKLEVDIYLPAENIAIEIDGPAHFFPIWGDEKLQEQIKADELKNSLLLGGGVKIIRLKNVTKKISAKCKRDTKAAILSGIASIKSGNNFIEIEV